MKNADFDRVISIGPGIGFAAWIFVGTVAFCSPRPLEMRYDWKPGQTHAYAVDVQTKDEDSVETVKGTVTYTVRTSEDGFATVDSRRKLNLQRIVNAGKTVQENLPFGPGTSWAESRPASLETRFDLRLNAKGTTPELNNPAIRLPQALGNLDRLLFPPLPPSTDPAWESERDCTIVYKVMLPISLSSRFGRTQQTSLPATERITSQVVETNGGLVRIRTHYDLRALQSLAGQPLMQLIGDGTNLFDSTEGVFRAIQFNGRLSRKTELDLRHTAISISCVLLEGSAKEQAMLPPPPPAAKMEELSAKEVEVALRDLRAPYWARRQNAASLLARAKPSGPKTAVEQALIAALADENRMVRQSAAKALRTWGQEPAATALIKRLDDPDNAVRVSVMETLGELKDARAAKPLVRKLAVVQDTKAAADALQAIGPLAEDAVLDALQSNNPAVCAEACRILKAVGTRKSVAHLERASVNSDERIATAAKEALAAINGRP